MNIDSSDQEKTPDRKTVSGLPADCHSDRPGAVRIHKNRKKKLLRLAAAGAAGILASGAVVFPAAAAGFSPQGMPGDPETAARTSAGPDDGSRLQRPRKDPAKASGEPGADVLDRWEIDEDDLPAGETENLPEIPDDILPYFQEKTSQLAGAYGDDLPPKTDLSRYSPRMDAVRARVRDTAGRILRHENTRLRKALRTMGESAGKELFPDLVAALQNPPHPEVSLSGLPAAHSASAKEDDAGNQGGGQEGQAAAENEDTAPGFSFFHRKEKKSGEEAPKTHSVSQFLGRDQEKATDEDSGDGQKSGPDADPFAAVYNLYGPLQWEELPVPPALYDFTIGFPANALKLTSREGQPLCYGLSNYNGFPLPVKAADQDLSAAVPFRMEAPGSVPTDPSAGRRYGPDLLRQASSIQEAPRRLVLIGDSRTVGMEMHVSTEGEVFWSAANSMGYSWMVNTGVPAVEDRIVENTDVVLLMGVNDLGNVDRYASYMNEKAAQWKERGARTYFVSVTPVDDRRSPNAKNARIESFNAYMQEHLQGVRYIDAYSRIRHSFGSPDGIHFDGATYREIYRIIRFYCYRGWYTEGGLWFYFDGGRPLTGWQKLDGKWQYMDGNGVRWIRDGWLGDVCLAPYPETGMLNPYEAVFHPPVPEELPEDHPGGDSGNHS